MLGNSGVGKTTLLEKYVSGEYLNHCMRSISMDFKIKQFKVKNKKIKLVIWDTAGGYRYRDIAEKFYRGAL